jgi:hypothetical protein
MFSSYSYSFGTEDKDYWPRHEEILTIVGNDNYLHSLLMNLKNLKIMELVCLFEKSSAVYFLENYLCKTINWVFILKRTFLHILFIIFLTFLASLDNCY